MLLDDLARDVADVLVADAGVVGALRRRIAGVREAERAAVLVEEVFLLEAEPGARVVEDGRALVRRVRRLAVGHHHFAHHEHAVLALAVGINRDRLQHAVGAVAFGLHRRAAVEAPQRKLIQRREAVELFDLRLAAQVRDGRVAVQPDVFELVLCHCNLSDLMIDDEPNLTRLVAKRVTSHGPGHRCRRSSSIKHANGAQTRATAKKWASGGWRPCPPRCLASGCNPQQRCLCPFARLFGPCPAQRRLRTP